MIPSIKVLIVDDSPVSRQLFTHILQADSGIEVVGHVRNGSDAVKFVLNNRPDVVLMDIHMPIMDGLTATAKIMQTSPVPIIIVSASWDSTDVDKAFQATQAGAVAVLGKPVGVKDPCFDEAAKAVLRTVKAMAGVKLVQRRPRKGRRGPSVSQTTENSLEAPVSVRMVAIGASTGGPPVLQEILRGLDTDFPAPLLIVQHIAPGFLSGLVDWLSRFSNLPVNIAVDGMKTLPGRVYLAPNHFNMGVRSSGHIVLTKGIPGQGLCPSISHLFRSAANEFGSGAVGVLLTGMGRDGAQELRLMKGRGAVTIVQDKATSVIYGMPGEALRLKAATHVLSPSQIALTLTALGNRR